MADNTGTNRVVVIVGASRIGKSTLALLKTRGRELGFDVVHKPEPEAKAQGLCHDLVVIDEVQPYQEALFEKLGQTAPDQVREFKRRKPEPWQRKKNRQFRGYGK